MKVILLSDLPATDTGHHHTHPALKGKCQQLELSPVFQTQPPPHWSQREIFHMLDGKGLQVFSSIFPNT